MGPGRLGRAGCPETARLWISVYRRSQDPNRAVSAATAFENGPAPASSGLFDHGASRRRHSLSGQGTNPTPVPATSSSRCC